MERLLISPERVARRVDAERTDIFTVQFIRLACFTEFVEKPTPITDSNQLELFQNLPTYMRDPGRGTLFSQTLPISRQFGEFVAEEQMFDDFCQLPDDVRVDLVCTPDEIQGPYENKKDLQMDLQINSIVRWGFLEWASENGLEQQITASPNHISETLPSGLEPINVSAGVVREYLVHLREEIEEERRIQQGDYDED